MQRWKISIKLHVVVSTYRIYEMQYRGKGTVREIMLFVTALSFDRIKWRRWYMNEKWVWSIGGIILRGETIVCPVSVWRSPPQSPYKLPWNWTQVPELRSRLLDKLLRKYRTCLYVCVYVCQRTLISVTSGTAKYKTNCLLFYPQ